MSKEFHKLDNEDQVFFYEQEFYVLSNFSAFTLQWKGKLFKTSEEAYHWEKFSGHKPLQHAIEISPSAHDAFKFAQEHKALCRPDWDDVKVDIMRDILRAKAKQHEYVRRKLLETGTRQLIEDSWRDDFWGWGENRDGKNMLGNLWTEIREELQNPSCPIHGTTHMVDGVCHATHVLDDSAEEPVEHDYTEEFHRNIEKW